MHRVTHMVLMVLAVLSSNAVMAADDGRKAGLFDGSFLTALAAVIVFSLVLVILGKFAWGPILSGLKDREQKIGDDLQAAEDKAKEAHALLDQYKQQLADAQADARKVIDEARQDAEAVRKRMVAETASEIDALRKRATDEIDQARSAALQEVYGAAGDLAVAVAAKVLQREISDADTAALVDASLKELGQLNG